MPPKDNSSPNYFTISVRADYFEKMVGLISTEMLSLVQNTHYATVNPHVYKQCKNYIFESLFLPQTEVVKKQNLLSLVVIKLITEFSTTDFHSNSPTDVVEEAKAIMFNPENMQLSINEIAEKLGYTPEHLIRSFKKRGLNSPNKVFTKIKLDYSAELLCSTDFTINKISTSIGFYSLHYFNKIFKNFFGLSPSAYRKKNAKFF